MFAFECHMKAPFCNDSRHLPLTNWSHIVQAAFQRALLKSPNFYQFLGHSPVADTCNHVKDFLINSRFGNCFHENLLPCDGRCLLSSLDTTLLSRGPLSNFSWVSHLRHNRLYLFFFTSPQLRIQAGFSNENTHNQVFIGPTPAHCTNVFEILYRFTGGGQCTTARKCPLPKPNYTFCK